MAVSVDQVADAMYDLVAQYQGKKKFKASDLTKEMIAKFGEENCGKRDVKKALREMVDSGKLTYKYEGGSYVTLPPGAEV